MEYKILLTALMTTFIALLIIRYFDYEDLPAEVCTATVVLLFVSLITIALTGLYIIWSY